MPKKQAKPFRKTILVLSGVAIFSVLMFGFAVYNLSTFKKHAITSKGKIVGFQKKRKVFLPVVEFKTKEGEIIHFTADMGQEDTTVVKTGSPVRVVYHPKSPQNAILDGFWQLWFLPTMILLFGTAPLIFILVLRWILVPKAKPQESASH